MYIIDGVEYKDRKEFLYKRQNGLCYYCEHKFAIKRMTKEHLKKRADGGRDTNKNIVLACGPCNHKRGDHPPQVWKIIREDVLKARDSMRRIEKLPYKIIRNILFNNFNINEKVFHWLLAHNNRKWKPLVRKYYKWKIAFMEWKAYNEISP